MRRTKRFMALLLAALLGLAAGFSDVSAASLAGAEAAGAGSGTAAETEAAGAGSGAAAETEAAGADAADAAEIPLLNYLVVEQPAVETPGIQRVMASFGDGGREAESAVLTYQNEATGQSYQVQASDILDDFVLFEMEYPDEGWSGAYCLTEIACRLGGELFSASFAEMGIDAAFGVNQEAAGEPDDVLLTEDAAEALAQEAEMNIVTLDGEGNAQFGADLQAALESAGCQAGAERSANAGANGDAGRSADAGADGDAWGSADADAGADGDAWGSVDADAGAEGDAGGNAASGALPKGGSIDSTGAGGIIVVLDAGHGGTDGGTASNGIVEKNVNLKIAQYCKAELEEYAGVTVYMTREDDTYLTLAQRAQVAADKKADVFISLHNNSSTNTAACGANVYYPNSNYNAACGTTGQALANDILSKLTDLGLASGGIHIRNSESGTKYPDGSLADYYGVIRQCKEKGIPGLIVEHAFVSNASDVKNYLSTDEQLKKLGVADAEGIAEYYNLSKGMGDLSAEAKSGTSIELAWPAQAGVSGYEIYRSTSSESGFALAATISSGDITSWTNEGLFPGITYYYQIRAFTGTGDDLKYGQFSSVASAATMARPVISSVQSKSSKELVVRWNEVSDAASYELYRSASLEGSYNKLATLDAAGGSSYTDSTVKAGKLYYYKLRALTRTGNQDSYSDYSEAVSGRTAKIPANLAVQSQGSATLRISWTGDPNASGYVIRRASSSKGKYKKIGTASGGDAAYFDDEGVTKNKVYYYKVQSYNYNGGVKGYSGYGAVACGKTIPGTSITRIVSTTSGQTISWKRVSGIDGYEIYRSTSKGGSYKRVKTISSSWTTSWTFKKPKEGVKYFYKVRTRSRIGSSYGYGSDSAARGARAGVRAVITKVVGVSATKLDVIWEEVADAVSYDIYRSTSKKGTFVKIGTASGEETKFRDKKLVMTTKYYYRVEAKIKGYKATGTSGMSGTKGGYPARKATITGLLLNEDGMLELRWKKVGGILAYQIFRSVDGEDYELLETISDPSETSYVDEEAAAGTTYSYKILLAGTYGGKTIYGAESSEASFAFLAPPAGLAVTSGSENRLDLSWSAVAGADGYEIYRSAGADGNYVKAGETGSSSGTSYSDLAVSQNVTYYYKVKAIVAEGGGSAFSGTASGTPVSTARAKIPVVGIQAFADGASISAARAKIPAVGTSASADRASVSTARAKIPAVVISASVDDASISAARAKIPAVGIQAFADGASVSAARAKIPAVVISASVDGTPVSVASTE